MTAVKIYGITIYIHDNNSENIYQIEENPPIVHLIKTKLEDDSYIYLATEKKDGIKKSTEEEDEKYEEDVSLEVNYIAKFKTICSLNVTIRETESDGNCYFRALSDQISGSQEGYIILRILILDFISDNREVFESCIDHEYFSSWEDFIYKMRQGGTFADGIVVVASAMSLRRQIIIHQHEQRPVLFKSLFSISTSDQIHLVYDSKNLHYSSLLSTDGNKLSIDASECICARICLRFFFFGIYTSLCFYELPIWLSMMPFKLVEYVREMNKRTMSTNILIRAKRELKMLERSDICFDYDYK
ncbi:unnamed protein product [Adineta steineri]|uniref:OTU domain-containing protein n=1 Tax=Adineta steineri TaxID=433720 RepID=A0A815DSI2_9BILA|nr:unnamed protein product [Adineta steineri]